MLLSILTAKYPELNHIAQRKQHSHRGCGSSPSFQNSLFLLILTRTWAYLACNTKQFSDLTLWLNSVKQ